MKKNKKKQELLEFQDALKYKKHSALVPISSTLTAKQIKAFDWLMYLSYQVLSRRQDIRVFQFPIAVFKKLLDCEYLINEKKKNKDTKALKEDILKPLQNYSIEYNILEKDRKKRWGVFSPLSWVDLKGALISWELPSILRNIVRILYPSIYTTIDLMVLKNLKYRSSIGIYNLLLDYKNFKGTPWISLNKYRKIVQSISIYEDTEDLSKLDHYNSLILSTTKEKVIEELYDKAGMVVFYNFKKEENYKKGRNRIEKVRIKFHWDKEKVKELRYLYGEERQEFLNSIFKFIDLRYGKIGETKKIVKEKEVKQIEYNEEEYTDDGMYFGNSLNYIK
jgi:hypothetical protein